MNSGFKPLSRAYSPDRFPSILTTSTLLNAMLEYLSTTSWNGSERCATLLLHSIHSGHLPKLSKIMSKNLRGSSSILPLSYVSFWTLLPTFKFVLHYPHTLRSPFLSSIFGIYFFSPCSCSNFASCRAPKSLHASRCGSAHGDCGSA